MKFNPSALLRIATPIFCSLTLLVPVIAAPVQAQAQVQAKAEPKGEKAETLPWLYKGSDVPVDKSWTFGELDNGLRYAVKRNGVPPGQVSIRLRVDAGSLMEQDHERGYAHFLEHLTFRGSTYVPDGEVNRVWQRLGATFGSDSNASTTPTQTVYQLDLPNASRASLDESFKILSGMVSAPSLTKHAVDAERPVVLAELREGAGPQAMLQDATRELFFAGQRMANRSPIGTPETLGASTPQLIEAFHHRWYRPEKTVIVVAGDGDPAIFEELLKKHFSNWQGKGEAGVIPDFGTVTATPPISRIVVEPSLPRFVSMVVARPWQQVNDTIVYNQQILIDLLALQMINRRLESRARAGGSYLQASVSQDDVSRSVDGTFINIVPLDENWEAALADVRGVIADATSVAPSPADIERELAEFDAALAIGVESYATEAARSQADNIINAVDIRETVATPQVALDVFRNMKELYTPQRLLASTQKLFAGTVTRGLLASPTPVENGEVRLATALQATAVAADNARVAQSNLDFSALPAIGKPGKVKSSKEIARFDVEQLVLSNGVRVLLFPNDSERNKIMVTARFGSGRKGLSASEENLSWSGSLALVASGAGGLDQEKIDKITTGRRIGLNFDVDDDAYEINADTRQPDLEDQLHLMAAKLQLPDWDPAPVIRARAAALIGYDSFESSPEAVLQRDLLWLLKDRDPRWKTPSKADFAALTPEQFKQYWSPILASGPIELMLFGDFDRDQAVSSILKTFGALKKRKVQPLPGDQRSPDFPAAQAEPMKLYHKGDKDRAAAVAAWPTGGGLADIQESRRLEILVSIFQDRLFEILRSQEGASYSPQVSNSWPVNFSSGGNISVISQLTPANVDKFYGIVKSISDDLKQKPVSDDELKRVVEPLRQLIARASSGNSFWLSQMKGASFDPQRFDVLGNLVSDYTVVTPAEIQALAQKYFLDDKLWKLVVLPEAVNAAAKLPANDNLRAVGADKSAGQK